MLTCNKDQVVATVKADRIALMKFADGKKCEYEAFEAYTKLSQVQRAIQQDMISGEKKVVLLSKSNCEETEIVLCYWCERNEYVVWTKTKNKEEYFWGHYFQSLTSAFEYFMNK